ncbi:unnamed protein product [Auanema sp. JU1783]|nr:unnamed protein product [Auanema sp. JU1783]
MDICNENLTSTAITRVDSLIFGYLNRQQYTKTVTALLEESPVLKNVGGRFGGGREIFIQINPTVCDKNLEYIVETFAQYGRFDVPPEFIDFGQQLRCLANDFSRMTSVQGFSRSENQQKMYGSRSKSKAPASSVPSKESSTSSQVSSATPTVYHIPQHPLTVDSPTPRNIPYLGKHSSTNSVLSDINNQQPKLNEHMSFPKTSNQSEKPQHLSNSCDVQPFHTGDNINSSNSNNLDPPIHSDDQDPSNMHSMLSDEGSSRRKRQHPHSFSERFVSKLADAASRSKQSREQVTSTTSAADVSTLDIGNEIYDLFDIRNLPSQLEEVVCRFDPEDRFYDFAGFMGEMEESQEHTFEQNIAPDVQQMFDQVPGYTPYKESSSPRTPVNVLPKEPIPELVCSLRQPTNLSLMPEPAKIPLNNTRPYVMKGPRNTQPKKQPKSLTERTFIKDLKLIEAKNVPLRTKITMDSLFDDAESSSSESQETIDKGKRSKSPDHKKKKDLREDVQKNREQPVKEKRHEKSSKDRREERDHERRRHEKEDKRAEESRKNMDEKPRISRVEKNDDRKKHDRFREESEKREQERKKKELSVRSAREQENQRREEAMRKRDEERRRATATDEPEPNREEERRIRDKRRTYEDDTSSHDTERSERESFECKNREENNKKKRSKDPGSSNMPDIFGEIEKNFDSLRRHDRSPSPDISFMNIKKLAPSTKIPKKGSEQALAQAERYNEPEPTIQYHAHISGKESDSSTSSSSQGMIRDIQPPAEYIPTASTSKVPSKSQMVCGLECDEPNLLIKSTVNDARIGLQFESASVKWKKTPVVETTSSKTSAEKEQDSRKRSSQNTLIGKLFNESGSPKDANKKKIKLDLSAIDAIMKKVHGNAPSTS